MKNLFFFFSLLLTFAACGEQESTAETDAKTPKNEGTAADAAKQTIQIMPFPNSTEFGDAKLKSMDYKNGKFIFSYSGTDYKLGVQTPDADRLMCANSEQGQHIHVIVDNEPYYASYATEFEVEVPDGEHHILSFLSRSYHESIKNGTAFLAKKVQIKNGNLTGSQDIKEPMLFYSRPKGTYTGAKETEQILLDYYLVNVTPESGYQVRLEINDEPPRMLNQWKSHYIKGLPMGDNTIKLTLVDKNGEAAQVPHNPVERTITLRPDPTVQ